MTATIYHGDCLNVLRGMPDNSVEAVVCDPPYGLSNTTPDKVTDTIVRWATGDREAVPSTKSGFMGAQWDAFVPPPAVWDECFRVLKPGGHLVAFAGSRTQDLMGISVRMAGFDIRENLAWLYGSGFPKSHDISKAIDKANGRKFEDRYALGRHIREQRVALGLTPADVNAWFGYKDGCQHWERQDPSGARVPTLADWAILKPRLGLSDEHLAIVERVEAEREVVGIRSVPKGHAFAGSAYGGDSSSRDYNDTKAHTPEAERWQGWGTALKPAHEPIILARKPFPGTVAQNTLTWGTGGLNIAACRITPAEPSSAPASSHSGQPTSQGAGGSSPADSTSRTSHEHGASRTDHSLSTPQGASSDAPLGGRSDLQPSASEGETSYPLAQGSRSDYRSSPCSCGARAQSGEAGDLGAAPSRNGVRGSLCGCAETQRIPSHQSMPCNDCTTGNVEPARAQGTQPAGRWPANVVLDPDTAKALDQQSGPVGSNSGTPTKSDGTRNSGGMYSPGAAGTSQSWEKRGGGASRFFKVVEPDPPFMYAAKAPKKERPTYVNDAGETVQHFTVKPVSICRWLVKLVTPEGGTVLDPFAGSGTTVEAAILEGFNVIGIEREEAYLPLIQQRIDRATGVLPMAS